MLTDEQIAGIENKTYAKTIQRGLLPADYAKELARAIEAEVRKQDEALIRQMLEALEKSQKYTEACANGKRVQWWGAQLDRAQDAINAARARLLEPSK